MSEIDQPLNADQDPTPSNPQKGSDLQFQVAEQASPETPLCAGCRQPIGATYYQAQGANVCPACAERIQSGQQAPPIQSLLKALIYGGAAAFAGFLLYTVVAVVTGLEIGLISIVVGVMVGKAIRYGSHGMGGRPQQILAVGLTYFAITTSYVATYIYEVQEQGQKTEQSQAAAEQGSNANPAAPREAAMPLMPALGTLALLALAAPFLSLASSGLSGLLSIVIIFFGLSQAWSITGRSEILVMGPYETSFPQ